MHKFLPPLPLADKFLMGTLHASFTANKKTIKNKQKKKHLKLFVQLFSHDENGR